MQVLEDVILSGYGKLDFMGSQEGYFSNIIRDLVLQTVEWLLQCSILKKETIGLMFICIYICMQVCTMWLDLLGTDEIEV